MFVVYPGTSALQLQQFLHNLFNLLFLAFLSFWRLRALAFSSSLQMIRCRYRCRCACRPLIMPNDMRLGLTDGAYDRFKRIKESISISGALYAPSIIVSGPSDINFCGRPQVAGVRDVTNELSYTSVAISKTSIYFSSTKVFELLLLNHCSF